MPPRTWQTASRIERDGTRVAPQGTAQVPHQFWPGTVRAVWSERGLDPASPATIPGPPRNWDRWAKWARSSSALRRPPYRPPRDCRTASGPRREQPSGPGDRFYPEPWPLRHARACRGLGAGQRGPLRRRRPPGPTPRVPKPTLEQLACRPVAFLNRIEDRGSQDVFFPLGKPNPSRGNADRALRPSLSMFLVPPTSRVSGGHQVGHRGVRTPAAFPPRLGGRSLPGGPAAAPARHIDRLAEVGSDPRAADSRRTPSALPTPRRAGTASSGSRRPRDRDRRRPLDVRWA